MNSVGLFMEVISHLSDADLESILRQIESNKHDDIIHPASNARLPFLSSQIHDVMMLEVQRFFQAISQYRVESNDKDHECLNAKHTQEVPVKRRVQPQAVLSGHSQSSYSNSTDSNSQISIVNRSGITENAFASNELSSAFGFPIKFKKSMNKKRLAVSAVPNSVSNSSEVVKGNIASLPNSDNILCRNLNLPKSTISKSNSNDNRNVKMLDRLIELYAAFFRKQRISIFSALTLLMEIAQCCSIMNTCPKESSNKFAKCQPSLISYLNFNDFLVKIVNSLSVVVKCAGQSLAKTLLSVDDFKRQLPILADELSSSMEDFDTFRGFTLKSPESFIRKFRDEVDSRNEYKSKVLRYSITSLYLLTILSGRKHCI